MLASISLRIANWKLAVLAILVIGFLCYLGCWQLSRADEKRQLLAAFAQRTQQAPLTMNELQTKQDLRYYRATLRGQFDNAHNFLLDNKILNGKVGYEVYTPFNVNGLPAILVDRGFIRAGQNRNVLPAISNIIGTLSVTGQLNLPPRYVSFGKMIADSKISYPIRVEYLDLKKLPNQQPFFPYILRLSPNDPMAYEIEWQAVETMPPERHIAYAVQWFALALTLLILCIVANNK